MAEPDGIGSPQEPTAPEKGRLKLWVILGGVLLLLGSVGFLTQNYLAGTYGSSRAYNDAEKVKSTMNLDSFLVNLADPDATRFIKVTFRLGLNENKLGEQLKDDPVVLAATRDAIISCLTTRTSDELLSMEGKEKLKKDIRAVVNKLIPKGRVIEVYIMDFVVQL